MASAANKQAGYLWSTLDNDIEPIVWLDIDFNLESLKMTCWVELPKLLHHSRYSLLSRTSLGVKWKMPSTVFSLEGLSRGSEKKTVDKN